MFSVSLRTLIGTVRGLLLAFCVAMGAWLLVSYVSLPKPALSTSTASTPVPEWPRPASAGDTDWSIFQRRQGTSVAPTASLAGRFRLAGTFYALGDNPETSPRAIIDDLEQGEQYLVREREQTTAFEVVRIYADRVIIRNGADEQELRLSYAGAVSREETPRVAEPKEAVETVLETSRFGKRVGASRWVLADASLREYYRELLDDPERLAALYLSLKPDYVDENIDGYYLEAEGEEDFFESMGLQNGDVIRRVNSLKMTSQGRAEYFVREFIQSRLGAVVLDVERGGKAEKMIYLIR